MTPTRPAPGPIGIVPLAIFLTGAAMTAVVIWESRDGLPSELSYYLAPGGMIATGAAAIMGRRSALTLKQLFVLVIVCSWLGNVTAVSAAAAVASQMAPAYAGGAGVAAGSITAWVAAYLAGMLIRRGARARRDEEIADTFG